MMMKKVGHALVGTLLLAAVAGLAAGIARAHCDTLDGPVAVDARAALKAGDVTPVLKWVQLADEPAIQHAFQEAVEVRGLNPTATALAERYFIETLVRIHRAGEGEPYTGLKPAGAVDPGIAEADRALETADAEKLVDGITARLAEQIHERFTAAMAAKAHADDSVEAGREYVEAYVAFIHYAEMLNALAGEQEAGHGHSASPGHGH